MPIPRLTKTEQQLSGFYHLTGNFILEMAPMGSAEFVISAQFEFVLNKIYDELVEV